MLIPLYNTANAQWAIGASYEVRSEDPENGFGFRLEKGFLNGVPLIDLGIRAHFSYFNDENSISRDGVTFSREIDVYDYGLAAVGGVKLGVVKPYVGLGIGNQQFKFKADVEEFDFDDSSFYWNGFGGAEITLLPLFNPFIEYRIARLTSADDINIDNISRLAIGVNLRF
jgi:opacity protein-like surface antigen